MSESIIEMTTFNSLVEMVGADFVGELVETFLDDTPNLLAEMDSALASGDAAAFHRSAHALKSTSASMGAMGLSALARDLEKHGSEGQLDEAAGVLERLKSEYEAVAQALKELV